MGMYKIDTLIHSTASGNISNSPSGNFFIGRKRYELTNHLGNVMATVTDRKLNTTGGNGLGPEIKNVYDYYAFGSHEPNRVFAKQRCVTDYDTTLGSPIDSDSFDDVSISGSTAYSNFTWETLGTANFNENCNNSNDFPDLVVCSNNLGGVETTFSGYTTGEVYHLQFDFFAWESTDCYYIDGEGCIDGQGITIEVYDSALALTHTQTLSTGVAQGFYFTAPSSSFKIKITYSNYYASWKRCCLLIDNVVISSTSINSQVACLKDKYRYGFNGMEKDDEVKGESNSLDFGARMYDSRLGRWLSLDKYYKEYIPISAYVFTINNPIKFVDADGNVVVDEQRRPVTITITKNNDGSYSASFALKDGGAVSEKFMENGGRLINTLIQIETGRKLIEIADKHKDQIEIKIRADKHPDGRLGETVDLIDKNGNILGSKVLIYEGSIDKIIDGDSEQAQEYKFYNLDKDQRVARTGAHELHHATSEDDLNVRKVEKRKLTSEEHEPAKNAGKVAAMEFGEKNKEKK